MLGSLRAPGEAAGRDSAVLPSGSGTACRTPSMALLPQCTGLNNPSGSHLTPDAPQQPPSTPASSSLCQPPYLTAYPSSGSSLEGEITPRSQTPAGTDVPQGCGALRIHPHISPPQILIETFPRGGRDQPFSSHGDVPVEVSVLTVTHGLGVSSGGRLALRVGTHGNAH